jgi:preprotein translocase SecF subunit
MISFVIICRVQINSSFIAALITIIGYSINNTIVVFDRIRENLRKESLLSKTNSELVDISVKETLTRTFYTSLTTIVSVALLAVIGVS